MGFLWVPTGFCLTRLNPLCFITDINAKTNSVIKIKARSSILLLFLFLLFLRELSPPLLSGQASRNLTGSQKIDELSWAGAQESFGLQGEEWEKCEALCPGPDQVIRGPGFLCCPINCLSFQNIVFDFKKHLKKIRPSPSEIQQQPQNPSWGWGWGKGSVPCSQGGHRGEEEDFTESVTKTTNYWPARRQQSTAFYQGCNQIETGVCSKAIFSILLNCLFYSC